MASTYRLIANPTAPLCDQTLYTVEDAEAGELGVGTLDELLALSDDGILPARDRLTFRQITREAVAA